MNSYDHDALALLELHSLSTHILLRLPRSAKTILL
jgi:hypothetical protein